MDSLWPSIFVWNPWGRNEAVYYCCVILLGLCDLKVTYQRIHSTKLNSPTGHNIKNIMCNSNNYIQMSGRLTSDVTPNDKKSFARFSIAHNMGKNADAMFLNCVIFKKEFDDNSQLIPWDILTKGREIFVTGKLAPNNWTDKEGVLHKSFDVVVNKIRDTEDR